jgi:hypothetical protein
MNDERRHEIRRLRDRADVHETIAGELRARADRLQVEEDADGFRTYWQEVQQRRGVRRLVRAVDKASMKRAAREGRH